MVKIIVYDIFKLNMSSHTLFMNIYDSNSSRTCYKP